MTRFEWHLARLLVLSLVSCLLLAASSAATAAHGYETGFRNLTNLQSDLVLALDKKKRPQVTARAELLANIHLPCLASRNGSGVGTPMQVSAGFIEFLNRLAHAKAIDSAERGVFSVYTQKVAQQAQQSGVPEFETRAGDAWSLDTMNRQASHFNQMAGALLAIDLAHHYLGHYRKQPPGTPSATVPPPINAALTESEWRSAVLRGAQNALACGLGTEGLRAVFECFEGMSERPAWATYFIHPKANIAKVNLELRRLERDFFAMNERLQKLGN